MQGAIPGNFREKQAARRDKASGAALCFQRKGRQGVLPAAQPCMAASDCSSWAMRERSFSAWSRWF